MTLVWIALGMGLLLVLVGKRIVWRVKRGSQLDLGFVSDQWISEHRQFIQQQDAPR